MTFCSELVIDGLSIRYRVDGARQGPWLVFSNSLMTDMSVWANQVEALGERFRILRYDQRGHGGSDVPAQVPTFQRLAHDVLALLDHQEIDRCTFVGLSMGVPTGLALWQAESSRIARLVLVDGQAKTAPGGGAMWQERIDFVRKHGMKAFADTVMPRWFSPDTLESGRAESVREGMVSTPMEGFAAMAGALQSFDFSDVLGSISVPTLLLVGENDGQAPVVMEHMHQQIAGSRYRVIPGAGHIPNWERPDLFNAVLGEFLTDEFRPDVEA
ncbi:alpha/beta fold hydrolase [Sphingobium sp. MK2]|uniref:alpha/beta fold hydrolase n=1 Tax=Sphingobium sp. MK2 TaxID=3116540 RepID=UPI0032E367D6